MRVVVDTNLVVSLALCPRGRAARIRHHLAAGAFGTVTSPPIVAEYAAALRYPMVAKRHKLSEAQLDELLFLFTQEVIEPSETPAVCRDVEDDMFFAAAVAGRADYIVSDDPDLQAVGVYEGIRVLSSGAFLLLLQAEGGDQP